MPGNSEVAGIFREVAALLRIKGGNVFRARAYEIAAGNIETLPEDISLPAKEGRLRGIPGIGADLEAKILEIISTGKLAFLSALKKSLPPGLPQLLQIPSLGPRTVNPLTQECLGFNPVLPWPIGRPSIAPVCLYPGQSEGQVLHLCAYTLAYRNAKYSLVRR